MIIIVQLILYCALFTGMVAYAVRGGAINGLYFYPKPVQERAFEIGMASGILSLHTYIRFFFWK